MRTAGVTVHVNTANDATARVIYLGVPSFGQVSIQWHTHMLQLQSPLNRAVFHGYALAMEVGQGRNFLVQQALEWSNAEGHTVSHVFFVDDDVLIPPDALTRLLAHRRPIIGGLYYAKTAAPQPLVLMGPQDGVLEDLPASGVIDCYAHGMGCTLIEMRVFKAMLATPGLVEHVNVAPAGERPQILPQFFKTTRDERTQDGLTGAPIIRQQTEDVFFLENAAKLGFQPGIDVDLFCWHWDAKGRKAYPLVRPGMKQEPAVLA